jgi:hypothetical protein
MRFSILGHSKTKFLILLAASFWVTSTLVAVNPNSVHATSPGGSSTSDPDPDFDRLDGKGKSRRRVDVIEWEGNLEVHVYPGGGLRGLALKLDEREEGKKVMVLGYRFDTNPKQQLIRRAMLSIPFRDGFHVYRDPASGEEYDKIIITNSSLGLPLVSFRTEAPPSQLYPDGHPLNTATASAKEPESLSRPDSRQDAEGRQPASTPQKTLLPDTDEEGAIRPFHW